MVYWEVRMKKLILILAVFVGSNVAVAADVDVSASLDLAGMQAKFNRTVDRAEHIMGEIYGSDEEYDSDEEEDLSKFFDAREFKDDGALYDSKPEPAYSVAASSVSMGSVSGDEEVAVEPEQIDFDQWEATFGSEDDVFAGPDEPREDVDVSAWALAQQAKASAHAAATSLVPSYIDTARSNVLASAREAEYAEVAGAQTSSGLGELIEPKNFSDYVQVVDDIKANSGNPGRAMVIKSHALVGFQDDGENNVANLLYLAHELGGHAYSDLVQMDLAAKQGLVTRLLGG